jgi:glycosyltransferase involved in cell wall biosynthesis
VSGVYQPLAEDEKINIQQEITQGRPYILFVGSLHPRKNVQRLLSAFDRLSGEFPSVDLVIVGSAMWKEKFLTIPEKISNRLHFTGHLPLDKLAKVMGAADIFAFVPYFEGFGIPVVEAMRCGIPILAANTTSLPEVDENAAIYCDPFSVYDITAQLRELLKNPTLRTQLAQIGLERSQQFSWDKTAEQVWEAIELQIQEKC